MSTIKALLPVASQEVGEELKKTVNARNLHKWVESKRQFSDWIKDRIEKYGFEENEDFIKIAASQICGAGNRGASIEYHVTTDMAKELAMVENNAKGREARRYFIAIEKAAQAVAKLPTYGDLARMVLEQEEKLGIAGEIFHKVLPDRPYGSIAPNGTPRIGIRRAAFVAAKNRITAAAELLHLSAQMELRLLGDSQ